MHINQICGAVLTRSILVGQSRLHHLLQALALRSQIVHHLVLRLKSLLQICNHLLFDLLKLSDAHFVEFASACSLDCHLIMIVRYRMVISISAIIRVLSSVLTVLQRLISLEDAHILFLVFLAVAIVLDILTCHFKVLTHARVICQDMGLVSFDTSLVLLLALVVHLSLLLLLLQKILLVPVHHRLVMIASSFDLVSEL